MDYDGNLPNGATDIFPELSKLQKNKLVTWAYDMALQGDLAVRVIHTTCQLRSASTYTLHSVISTDELIRGKAKIGLKAWYFARKTIMESLSLRQTSSIAQRGTGTSS